MKVAIIVEPDFLTTHVGVRILTLAVACLLKRSHHVEFVTWDKDMSAGRRWKKIFFKSDRSEQNSGIDSEIGFVGTPQSVYRSFRKFYLKRLLMEAARPESERSGNALFSIGIGSDLSLERYDVALITNPWIACFGERLPARCVIGVVLDVVPNLYSITSDRSKPFRFASEHAVGFAYYARHCDWVMGISAAACDAVQQLFHFDSAMLFPIPPLPPAPYHCLKVESFERPSDVALAGPFDLRKGLRLIPNLLNAAGTAVKRVRIYGWIRCRRAEVKEFFHALAVGDVEWYPFASGERVISSFRQSRLLLFPSYDEGLGLPLLEAQYAGCRVAVQDKPPMNGLALSGAVRLTGDVAKDSGAIAAAMTDDFDDVALQQEVRRRFSPDNVLNAIEERIAITLQR